MPTEHIEVEVTVLQEGRSAYRPRGCCESLLAVLLPPVYLCLRGHKCCTIIINIILTILGLWPGMIHALVKEGTGCCSACLICLLPPVGLWMAVKACNCDVLICLLFTLTIFGGIWWAVWKSDKHPTVKLSQS
jgi:uncharacterized membrane protein YqaE (UPF0057 family)